MATSTNMANIAGSNAAWTHVNSHEQASQAGGSVLNIQDDERTLASFGCLGHGRDIT